MKVIKSKLKFREHNELAYVSIEVGECHSNAYYGTCAVQLLGKHRNICIYIRFLSDFFLVSESLY